MKVLLALLFSSVFTSLTSVEGSDEAQNSRGIRRNDANAKSATKQNRLLSSTNYELGAPKSRCTNGELNASECKVAAGELGINWYYPYTNNPMVQCGCFFYSDFNEAAFNSCTQSLPNAAALSSNMKPLCNKLPVEVPVADGGGDPHYKLFSSELVTVQALCDINLFTSDAHGGVHVHSRHSMPLLKEEEKKGYSIISNLALRIGGDTGTVWELMADGPKLFKDGIEFDSFEDDESTTSNSLFTTIATTKTSENGVVDDHESAPKRYSIQKRVKGQRSNIIEYIFRFADNSKIVFRGNRHFKMTFVAVHGFSNHSVEGFFGRTDKRGFFDRQGNEMTSNRYVLRKKNYKFTIEKFAQEWQVRIDEPNLFMNKSEYPVAPQECSFLDKGSIEGVVDSNLDDTGNNSSIMDASRRRRLSDVDEAAVVMAMKACGHLSDDNPKKKFCIDDVITTNEAEIALDSFYEE